MQNSKFKMQNYRAKSKIPAGVQRRGVFRASEIAPSPGLRNFALCTLHFALAQKRAGFTILETVVAIVVILGAVTGPFVLATRGILSSSASKNKIIAANLAQEGIELVRAVRDNNLACDYLDGGGTDGSWAWDADPDGSGRFTTPSLNNDRVAVNNVNPAFNCGGLAGVSMVMPLFDTVSSCASPLLFNSATGRYSYSGGQPTPFSRCISACSPPNASPCNNSADAGIPPSNQMDVISTVRWLERGVSRQIQLRVRLYRQVP